MNSIRTFIALAALFVAVSAFPALNDDGEIFSGERKEKRRWPGGVVVYNYNGTFSTDQTAQITLAMTQITQLTASTDLVPLPCITFRQATDADVDIVQISNHENACNSPVGRRGGNQTLMLAKSCFKRGLQWGTLAHEMIHAIGFHHEHIRPDRDDYVEILTENIKEKGLSNFKLAEGTDTYDVPYDYTSIMHYAANEYSKDSKTLNTIRSKIEGKEALMGQRDTMSNCDIAKIRYQYKCAGNTVMPTECRA